ncbi:hypothetical protein RAB80_003878 [Fusarium oxysporum f. sp. vasinfectum]|nr:hypothetical protein RAB80_003878 [Fusarium oxysporum f. sp. vasinfectum]
MSRGFLGLLYPYCVAPSIIGPGCMPYDVSLHNRRGRGATSAGGWDAGTAVMKFESRMPFGFWVESNNTVDREASSEAKPDCSEYLNGHVFDVNVWTTTWHLLHVLGARVAALTAVDLA